MVFIDGTVTTGPNANNMYINFTINGRCISVWSWDEDEHWRDTGPEEGTYEDYKDWGIHFIPQELL